MEKANFLKFIFVFGIITMLLAFVVIPETYPWIYEVLLFNLGLWPWLYAKHELKKYKKQSS
jgi:Flp pilus assembly protein TadB